jgi:hypothetical protein
MGGQACILYGSAEFSRDIDFAVAVAPGNLSRLRRALADLLADPVYFPHLSAQALLKGHACHFRCRAKGVEGLRIDVMSVLRGVAPFESLWKRREVFDLPGVGPVALMSLPDLVDAKKTQRDKDWPMIRRLVEADIERRRGRPSQARVAFWLRDCRTPELLCELASQYPRLAKRRSSRRGVLLCALEGKVSDVARSLREEEEGERKKDRLYWAPLRAELERWRLSRPRP